MSRTWHPRSTRTAPSGPAPCGRTGRLLPAPPSHADPTSPRSDPSSLRSASASPRAGSVRCLVRGCALAGAGDIHHQPSPLAASPLPAVPFPGEGQPAAVAPAHGAAEGRPDVRGHQRPLAYSSRRRSHGPLLPPLVYEAAGRTGLRSVGQQPAGTAVGRGARCGSPRRSSAARDWDGASGLAGGDGGGMGRAAVRSVARGAACGCVAGSVLPAGGCLAGRVSRTGCERGRLRSVVHGGGTPCRHGCPLHLGVARAARPVVLASGSPGRAPWRTTPHAASDCGASLRGRATGLALCSRDHGRGRWPQSHWLSVCRVAWAAPRWASQGPPARPWCTVAGSALRRRERSRSCWVSRRMLSRCRAVWAGPRQASRHLPVSPPCKGSPPRRGTGSAWRRREHCHSRRPASRVVSLRRMGGLRRGNFHGARPRNDGAWRSYRSLGISSQPGRMRASLFELARRGVVGCAAVCRAPPSALRGVRGPAARTRTLRASSRYGTCAPGPAARCARALRRTSSCPLPRDPPRAPACPRSVSPRHGRMSVPSCRPRTVRRPARQPPNSSPPRPVFPHPTPPRPALPHVRPAPYPHPATSCPCPGPGRHVARSADEGGRRHP